MLRRCGVSDCVTATEVADATSVLSAKSALPLVVVSMTTVAIGGPELALCPMRAKVRVGVKVRACVGFK